MPGADLQLVKVGHRGGGGAGRTPLPPCNFVITILTDELKHLAYQSSHGESKSYRLHIF